MLIMKTLFFAMGFGLSAAVGFMAGVGTYEDVVEERLQGVLHHEAFVMDAHTDGSLSGEPVTGKGEGVFIEAEDARALTYGMSIDDGDVVRVYWTVADAYENEWENIVTITKEDKQ